MKLYLITSIIATTFITLMSMQNDENTRYIYLIPCLIFFFAALLMFGVDYDKEMIKRWKNNEKKVYESAYIDFVSKYHKEEKI
jgi:bacteriorhodopsin